MFYYRDNLFAPIISGLSGVTLLPIILSFMLAMLSSGYSRDILYSYHITKCSGATFTIMVCTPCVGGGGVNTVPLHLG